MALFSLLLLAFVAYLGGLAIYRLYLSPLSKFPGPKLAALSRWYEAYYDILLRGQFRMHFAKLHERYGPIVRIGPEELHIRDPAFWDEIYVRRPKADKPSSFAHRFGNPDSGFAMVDAVHHRALRAPLNPFFSRRAILEQQAQVQAKAELLCQGFKRMKGPFNVLHAYSAFTCDVVYDFCFGFTYNQLESEGFQKNFVEQFNAITEFGNIAIQFPWMNTLVEEYIPESWIKKVPLLALMAELKQDFLNTANKDRKAFEKKDSAEGVKHSMFHAVLESDLPPSDKTEIRMAHEAQVVISGGIITSAWALTVATFYLLTNEAVLTKLQNELREAIPNVSEPGAFNYEKLERLPYLTGCVKEGIRLSEPVSGRLGRVFHEPVPYKEWEIPANITVSMNIADVSFNESVFPEAKQFKPERWSPGATKLADGASLESYFVSFSKGPRMCLGMPLAYMELYIALAYIYRNLDLKLYETDVSDVEIAYDFFIPIPKLDSKGVRVQVAGDLK